MALVLGIKPGAGTPYCRAPPTLSSFHTSPIATLIHALILRRAFNPATDVTQTRNVADYLLSNADICRMYYVCQGSIVSYLSVLNMSTDFIY